MTEKEKLQARINQQAKQPQQTTHILTESVKVANMIGSWANRLNGKNSFGNEVINLKETLKEKVQLLAAGKPAIVEHEDGEEYTDIPEAIGLQELLYIGMGQAFENGSYFVELLPIGKKGKIITRLADPRFPNVVKRLGGVNGYIYEAEIWTQFKLERAAYWKRTIYTNDTIRNMVYSDKEGEFQDKKQVKLKEFNKKVSKNLRIKAEQPNKLGFIPVEQITYLPVFDLSTRKIQEAAPANRLKELQVMLNEATKALRIERHVNRTKMLIDQDLVDTSDKERLSLLAEENILAVVNDSGGHDGNNKVVELMQGEPKLKEYWEDITSTIKLAVQTLKLSELGEGESSNSATEAIFNKGNDVETINALSLYHQKALARVLEKAYLITKRERTPEEDIDSSKWGIQIIPNIIMNEAKLTEIIVSQLSAGLINMTAAKAKLEGISKQDAEVALSEEEKFLNPALEATTSFGDDDEEDKDNKDKSDNPSGGENKPNPKKK